MAKYRHDKLFRVFSLAILTVACAHDPLVQTTADPAPSTLKEKAAKEKFAKKLKVNHLKPSSKKPLPTSSKTKQGLRGHFEFTYSPSVCASKIKLSDKNSCKPLTKTLKVKSPTGYFWDKGISCWVAHGTYVDAQAVKPSQLRVVKNTPRKRHPYDPVTMKHVQLTLCEKKGTLSSFRLSFTHPSHTRVQTSGIAGRYSSNNLVLAQENIKAELTTPQKNQLQVRFSGQLNFVSCYRSGRGKAESCRSQKEGPIKGEFIGDIMVHK